ncbi:RNA polymerase sigma factor [Sphingobacterium griseoflavum]|uniref:DNA-directed RNA polymerase sigma-70 factor n=1 Tax=Sphingobacterium griseoflavum TaxID=1474952 RepID=A0ABQ3I1T6_9SPHI|nr:RNA polymerase sigma-70 factor [Sphingobacterium griseoflavum]GHE48047.1 DNA-directed RNA polymerase sigma-70 factor [Sphingobacterium griseoflavum]
MFKKLVKRKTFDSIFRENYTYLYRYALHIIGDEEESRDIVSAVFEGLWKNFDQVDEQRVKPYLMVSIRNRCVDFMRKNTLQHQYTSEYLHTLSDYYDELGEQTAQEDLVDAMLNQLPEPGRQILEMCYLQRMKYAEVAAALGISRDTVKKHMVRALKILRAVYSKKKYDI